MSAFASDMVYEIDVASFDVTRSFESSGMPQAFALSPDGGELYVATQAGFVDVDGQKLAIANQDGWVEIIAIP